MRRTSLVFAVFLAMCLALAPGLAFARAGSTSSGGGSSMGSRGSRTYSAPAPTNTAPATAEPMQRSLTPAPSATPFSSAPAPMSGRSNFTSALLGGLIGAGIGGMLFGGGFFHGIAGFGGFIGLLLQIFLVVMVVRFLLRRFLGARQPALAQAGRFARGAAPAQRGPVGSGGQPTGNPLAITAADYQAFEHSLQAVQAAWSRQDTAALGEVATPEMVNYFAGQLADLASRGERNIVKDVKLEQGDLAEAWAESGREYATVAMRFSMIDITLDRAGNIVDGHSSEHVQATEVWTFVRVPGGNWLLSAIQQTH